MIEALRVLEVLTRRNVLGEVKFSFDRTLSERLVPARGLAKKVMPRIELKSLILAQIERWRHALHMQVER